MLFEVGRLSDRGDSVNGLAQLIEGTAAWRATGNKHFTAFLLGLQAEACLKAQKLEEGLAAVADGLAIAASGGDTYWLAELSAYAASCCWLAARTATRWKPASVRLRKQPASRQPRCWRCAQP